jgi:hypothetical protein
MRAMQRVALATVLVFCLGTGAAWGSRPQSGNGSPGKGAAVAGVSAEEIEALKPLALIELRQDLSEGGEQPSEQEVREALGRCQFRKLPLGKLGTGVLMEFHDENGGANSGSYAVYLRRNGRYARIARGGGFGPYVLAGVNGIPDLAFGSTSGVCTENFVRLRYAGSSYKPDACVQNVRDENSDDCHAEVCNDGRKLPMFPAPDPSALQ